MYSKFLKNVFQSKFYPELVSKLENVETYRNQTTKTSV
ncbi:hypothetical protein LSS_20865 [Leptospira santarosai serovar Shermani str. LT 821]|uniref:Uncharacterized protein n=1 Tax=Leptospira santarosai serovar Shermani str. LT 821 TaxID=758847 RepID=A0A097ESA5_9LEPT|nr:hypothetical protein LSS_20865 [Leptospira santarosai serovar Shermani str. LT 821]